MTLDEKSPIDPGYIVLAHSRERLTRSNLLAASRRAVLLDAALLTLFADGA
jgi:hypothetical protein